MVEEKHTRNGADVVQAARSLAPQRQRAAAGSFRAEIAKILWVATTPP